MFLSRSNLSPLFKLLAKLNWNLLAEEEDKLVAEMGLFLGERIARADLHVP